MDEGGDPESPPLLISTLQFAEKEAAPKTQYYPSQHSPTLLLGLRVMSGMGSSNASHHAPLAPSGLPTTSRGIYYLFPSISINNMELEFHDGLHNKQNRSIAHKTSLCEQ